MVSRRGGRTRRLAAGKIRKPAPVAAPRIAIVLPPREGFSPDAVGAIGLLVHRLATPEDLVIGEATPYAPFAGHRFFPAATPFWPPTGRAARYRNGALKTLRALKPDLIEIHNRPAFVAPIARAFPQARIALFLHNDPHSMRGARTAAERAGLARRAEIVCVSAYLASRFPEAAAHVLPNCIDLSALPPRATVREKLILFAGRIVADKGADAFVRACAAVLPQLPGWRAEMIGADRFWPRSAPTPFQKVLAPLASAAGIPMRGYLPHPEVLRAMAQAAIVVVPSRWPEPFGLTALEALASGAALICPARGGLPEVAGAAATHADPDTEGDLEAAILRLAANLPAPEPGLARAALFDAPQARIRLAELRQALLSARFRIAS